MKFVLRAAAAFLTSLALVPAAWANPQGAQVRQGQIRVQQSPGMTLIRQQSQRAVIDWDSFSIDAGETTRFLQPDDAAAVLNRVRGPSASVIDGVLRGNGRVFLINPNGILVGPQGIIDVAGFVASTLDTSDRDFLRGGDLRFAGTSGATVVNLGAISASGGDVVLMGASVLNAGTIRAPRGTAALASGQSVLLAEEGEERVFVSGVNGTAKGEGVVNSGTIEANIAELKAHGGNVYGLAVNNTGRIAATGVTRQGGQIFLSAKGGRVRSTGSLQARSNGGSGGRITVDSGNSGRTEIGGTVDASSMDGAGGEIAVLGGDVEIFAGTLVLNDGLTQGGSTVVGGGARGRDPRFSNSTQVRIGNGVLLSADATGVGNGGSVVVFATGTTTFDGLASARGGFGGGNGGFIELSGQERLYVPDLAGQVRLSAPRGSSGSLLLDPLNLTIFHGIGGGIAGTSISDGALADALANFSVTLATSAFAGPDPGDITVDGDVDLQWNSPHHLKFNADRDFVMDPGAAIQALGNGSFEVEAKRSIRLLSDTLLSTAFGDLTLVANPSGTNTPGNFTGIALSGARIQTTSGGSISLIGQAGDSGSNNVGVAITDDSTIEVGGSGALNLWGNGGSAGSTGNRGITISNATLRGTGGADLILDGRGGSGTSGNDGILLGTDALLEVEDGTLDIDGRATGTASGGIIATADSGALSVSGSGELKVFGVSNSSAPAVDLGNPESMAGGTNASRLSIDARGDLFIGRPLLATGYLSAVGRGFTQVDATVTSLENDLNLEGFDLTVNAPLSASGDLSISFGDLYSESFEPDDGVARINSPLSAGGRVFYYGGAGFNDLLTFEEFSEGPVTLFLDDLFGIENVDGSASGEDRVHGFGDGSVFEIAGEDRFSTDETDFFSFENLSGGDGNDRFVFLPGGRLSGSIDGGKGANVLDYSSYDRPVSILFDKTATGVGGNASRIGQIIAPASGRNVFTGPDRGLDYRITGKNTFETSGFRVSGFSVLRGGSGDDRFLFDSNGSLSGSIDGGGGKDTLSYAGRSRAVTVRIGPNTATGFDGGFSSIERIVGSRAGDRFRFTRQATLSFVDGRGGFDRIEIDDSRLKGENTYTISPGRVSRNPLYRFDGFESLRLFLGPGTNTVNSRFLSESQYLYGGRGFNTLNLPGVTSLNEANPIGNVYHYNFDAPRPAGTGIDLGGLLQLEVDQSSETAMATSQTFVTVNRFSEIDPDLLSNLFTVTGGTFSSALVAQAAGLFIDGTTYWLMHPFPLDGDPPGPTDAGIAALFEQLTVASNLELAAAIGYDGGIRLFQIDGPCSLDLSGALPDPVLAALLAETLSIGSAADLSSGLGIVLRIWIRPATGVVPFGNPNAAPDASVVAILATHLNEEARAELAALIGATN